ncbi:MAG: hypothetical protein U0133_02375 [Gemmatimonadales bacterium]
MERRHTILTEATDAGLLGALAVAVWFLIHDSLRGRPLLTPSVLGQLFLLGNPHPVTSSIDFGAMILYTVVHFLLFLAFGFALAALIRVSVEQPVARFGVLVLFAVFELLFYVALRVVSSEVSALFPVWTVAGANLLATAVMGGYFWFRYPELKQVLREEPLGA